MYYNRELTQNLEDQISQDGVYRWIVDKAKSESDLDLLIGKNNGIEWVSVYRGLSRIFRIVKKIRSNEVLLDAAETYLNLCQNHIPKLQMFTPGITDAAGCAKSEFQDYLTLIRKECQSQPLNRFYENMKEGYYQTKFSRQYGIAGNKDDDFVIIDKEAVLGYKDENEKQSIYKFFSSDYEEILKDLSNTAPKTYGQNLASKSLGNELDFLALNKEGEILLIEFKHFFTGKAYLAPLQIGFYYDLFTYYMTNHTADFQNAVFGMLKQKQRLGLINSNWQAPSTINKIVPVIVVADVRDKGSSLIKMQQVLNFSRQKKGTFLQDLKIFTFNDNPNGGPYCLEQIIP